MRRFAKKALILAGTILFLGSPGACDRGVISFWQAMIQMAAGIALWWIAYITSKLPASYRQVKYGAKRKRGKLK